MCYNIINLRECLNYKLEVTKMEKMVQITKKWVPEEVEFKVLKETSMETKIQLTYDGESGVAFVYHTVTPGFATVVAKKTVLSALASIYLKKNDLDKAKKYMDLVLQPKDWKGGLV
jgi:hypothetical protein